MEYSLLSFGPISFDLERYKITVAGEPIHLTHLEFKLLHALIVREGRVATRDVLLKDVFGYPADLRTRTLDTHVKRLRLKLGVARDYIETVRSVGFRMREEARISP